MDSEYQTEPLLSQVEAGVAELERAVEDFEEAVTRIEQRVTEMARPDYASRTGGEHPRLLLQALHTKRDAEERVYTANAALNAQIEIALQDGASTPQHAQCQAADAPPGACTPLPAGTLVCAGRYRLLRLLFQRPRVHLYLARRLDDAPLPGRGEQPLVAIRELVLSGLDPASRQEVEHAAFAEFAAPRLFGSPHLPGVGDRPYIENERHYLVMQPRQIRGNCPTFATLLSELLPDQTQTGQTPGIVTALSWGIRLCQTVVRLHGMGIIQGELTPDMLLVNREGRALWSPLLLACWPPALAFWPGQSEDYYQIFALSPGNSPDADTRAFAAPEVFTGCCDVRSDVYALGAMLYLFFTGNTPAPVAQRLQAEKTPNNARDGRHATRRTRRRKKATQKRSLVPEGDTKAGLIPPRTLNASISPSLEQLLLRALALDPQQRFASVQDLTVALERIYLKNDAPASLPQARASRLRRLLSWLRK